MNGLKTRVLLATVVIAASQLLVMWVRTGYTFRVGEPTKNVAQLPEKLGQWHGRDHALDPKVAEFLNATSQVSRMYTSPSGEKIALHAAVWTQGIEDDVAPHHPFICYPNAGWTIKQSQLVLLSSPHGELPLSFCMMERSGETIVTCHWYQMGNERFTDRTGGRGVHRKLWGKPQWPPIVKVLLQTPSGDLAAARPRLEKMAINVFSWTNDIE